MQSAVLDLSRHTWTREVWEKFKEDEEKFSQIFLAASLRCNKDEINELVDLGKNYYHFPEDYSTYDILRDKNLDFYLYIMNLRPKFYQYTSL